MNPLNSVGVLVFVGIVLCGCGRVDPPNNSSISTGAETTATIGAASATTAGSSTIESSTPSREAAQPGRAAKDSGQIGDQPTSLAGPSANDSGKISSANLGAKASYYVVNDSGQISHRPAPKKREE